MYAWSAERRIKLCKFHEDSRAISLVYIPTGATERSTACGESANRGRCGGRLGSTKAALARYRPRGCCEK